LDIGSVNYLSGNEPDATKKDIAKNIKAKYKMELEGYAINYTANFKSSKVKCIIYSDNLVTFKCIGQYDNITLFGSFDMSGKLGEVGDESYKISFDKGTVLLGNDNSGYPFNTELSHTLNLSVYSDVVYGYYYINETLPYNKEQQKGEIMLKKIKTNFNISNFK
jgi:hypothetical protein